MHLLLLRNRKLLAWDKRGIAIPLMDQNERTVGTGIFLAISKSSFFLWMNKSSPPMLWIRKLFLFVGDTVELAETDWLKGISKTQQLSVIKPSLTFRLEKNVWNAFIKTLYGFRLNSTITFVTLLASLDYRSVTEAKYLWGLCMSITSVCFPPYVCSIVTE